jgi:hypothetical protein
MTTENPIRPGSTLTAIVAAPINPTSVLELAEVLVTLDPLRHLIDSHSARSAPPSELHNPGSESSELAAISIGEENLLGSTKSKSELLAVLPHQHFFESHGILDLTFSLSPSLNSTDQRAGKQASVKLIVDSAPGCGGIAWPAGQVTPIL